MDFLKATAPVEAEDAEWEDDEDGLIDRYLLFGLADENYALPIEHIHEIVTMLEITIVPEMPEHVRGVVNLRGHVVPVVDLRLRFGLEERPYDDRTCVIITAVDTITIGVVVDRVMDVDLIPEDRVDPRPEALNHPADRFISGIGHRDDGLVLVLDASQVVAPDHRDSNGGGDPV